MLSEHYKSGLVERLLVTILTVDPASGRVEVIGKDAAVIQINVSQIAPLFRWPVQGELWTIVRENGVWKLEYMLANPDSKSINTLTPGEGIVQTEKIWTPSGDYLARRSELDNEIDLLEANDAILDSRLDTIENRIQTFNPSSVSSIDLGPISGDSITGVKISHDVVITGAGVPFLFLRPNGAATISGANGARRSWWDGSAIQNDTVYFSNSGTIGGIVLGRSEFGTTDGVSTGQGEFMTRRQGSKRRHYRGQYTAQDIQSNASLFMSVDVAGYWNDTSTALTSLTIATQSGTFTGRITMEILP